ncbi:hypothetical protein E6H30_00955 [Candidatus Bathyarchaeota archaeon]|nr:MAG: hypothetical protein E6H30_00955 [Candidatus Bathyarchaeota archaeon]
MLVLVNPKREEEAASLYQELHNVVLALDENWAEAYDKWAEGPIAEAKGEASSSLLLLEECVSRWKRVEKRYELARVYGDLARSRKRWDERLRLRIV